jgi:hypothetical protein
MPNQAPAGQGWYPLLAPAGVENNHAGREDQPVNRQPRLAVRGREAVGVPAG